MGGGLKGFTKMTFSAISYKFIMEFSIFRDFLISFHVFAGKNFPGGLADPPHKFNAPVTCTMTLHSDGHGSKPRSLLNSYTIVDIESILLKQEHSLPDWFQLDEILH